MTEGTSSSRSGGSKAGLASRLYRGEAGVDVVGKRKVFFAIAGILLAISLGSILFRGFTLGIDFKGGNEFQLPSSVGTLEQVEEAFAAAGAEVNTAQTLGNDEYKIRTGLLSADDAADVKEAVAEDLGINQEQISDTRVSEAWGGQVTEKALLSLGIFLVAVVIYLVFRFEWRMAVAAVASLILDLVLTAGVYSLVGFEVTPSTIIGFLTILGFALYDVVVVFDKVQENTKGITGSSIQTYPEAANLAVNQTLMRSINTGLVALLPVGGLLFIGAGLLQAGTLKDLGLVLFVGMGIAVYSSIFFATPVLTELKSREPRLQLHTQRVLTKRSAVKKAADARAAGLEVPAETRPAKGRRPAAATVTASANQADDQTDVGELASSAPRPGARAGQGTRSGTGRPGQAKRGGRSGGGRPGGAKRR